MTFRKKALFSVLTGALVVGFLEITLGVLALVFPRVHDLLSDQRDIGISQVIPDARLRVRPNPAYPGHDAHGFRNPNVPAKVSIIALGDSQTYGTGVESAEAWPKQLERAAGQPVYNMASGGYGPAHSLLLWDEAVAMHPEIVIEAFYAGNDLYDSYNLVYKQDQLTEFKSDPDQFEKQLKAFDQKRGDKKSISAWKEMRNSTPVDPASLAPGDLLSRFSNLYGLCRRCVWMCRRSKELSPEQEWAVSQRAAKAKPAYFYEFNKAQLKTLLTFKYRLRALDLENPRMSEGMKISWQAMEQMHVRAEAKQVRFIALLIPTKEMVFFSLSDNPSPDQLLLAENEQRCWTMTKEFLTAHGIEFLDALPALQSQLAAGKQPYRMNADGHPNVIGHKAIAQLVADALPLKPATYETPAKAGPLAERPAKVDSPHIK